jgi:hypothetical protein
VEVAVEIVGWFVIYENWNGEGIGLFLFGEFIGVSLLKITSSKKAFNSTMSI